MFCCFVDTNIQPYFELANFFKDIFQLFSKTLIIIENKTAANSTYAPLKRAHSCITVNEILLQKLAYITGENPENIRIEVNEAAAKRSGDIFARIMVSTDNEAVEKRLNDIMKDQDLGKIDEED